MLGGASLLLILLLFCLLLHHTGLSGILFLLVAHSTLYPSARVTLSSHPTATPTAHIQPRLQLVSLKSADAVEKCAKLQTTHLNVGCPDSSISMALNSHKTSVKINSLCFSTTPLQIYCESPVLAEGDTDNQSRTLG